MTVRRVSTLSHWGAYRVETDGERVTGVAPLLDDPEPSPIGDALRESRTARVARPSIRRSWLRSGPGVHTAGRGREPFVEVPWDEALDLVAEEVGRVRRDHGDTAIYAGSYGWASAGRFHHAQSQLKRFLTLGGGFVAAEGTYSHAAAEVVLPRVTGLPLKTFLRSLPTMATIAEHTELFVSFGGVPTGNTQIVSGGTARHEVLDALRTAARRGCRYVSLSPVRSAVDVELGAEWLPLRPGTDAAVLLALLQYVLSEQLVDAARFAAVAHGVDELRAYLDGEVDGVRRDPGWAASVSGVSEGRLTQLAHELTAARTLLNATWSTQRTDDGEHAVWSLVALGAALGQLPLPGGGFGFGYGSMGSVGATVGRPGAPAFPTGGPNPVAERIPVARIADLLLHPGEEYLFDGARHTYPEIALVWWAGGNPFHHHQDLHRLDAAWQRPATIIVNEPFWTATATRADVVFPSTIPLERRDLGGGTSDAHLVAMEPAVLPFAEARDDHAIFAALADRLGYGEAFTEGRSVDEWLTWMYETFRAGHPGLPDEATFRTQGSVPRTIDTAELVRFQGFFRDPASLPLPTPSGRIELMLEASDGTGLPAHPHWEPPAEWLGDAADDELHLLSPQPRDQLHSQYDWAEVVQRHRKRGRAVVAIHPVDAAARAIEDDQVVRLRNDRGRCLAVAHLTDAILPRTVVLPTGAWWDPAEDVDGMSVCLRGNPNVLTRDVGTSDWGQGTSAHTCLVRIEPAADAPDPRPHGAPRMEARDA
jgi:biotin/methionine sulfoxide reductase